MDPFQSGDGSAVASGSEALIMHQFTTRTGSLIFFSSSSSSSRVRGQSPPLFRTICLVRLLSVKPLKKEKQNCNFNSFLVFSFLFHFFFKRGIKAFFFCIHLFKLVDSLFVFPSSWQWLYPGVRYRKLRIVFAFLIKLNNDFGGSSAIKATATGRLCIV